jgi:hypothetical protein
VLKSILNDNTGIDAVPGLREELKRDLKELYVLSKPVRILRHKYLAHLDHAIAAREVPRPPPVPWECIAHMIDSAERIYRRYRIAVYSSDVGDFALHALGGPRDLVRVLEAGEKWRAQPKRKRKTSD